MKYTSMLAAIAALTISSWSIAAPVNINTASVEQLASLKGIGEMKAQAIVAYRDHHGKFTSPEELTKVKGIGEATLASNRQLLVAE